MLDPSGFLLFRLLAVSVYVLKLYFLGLLLLKSEVFGPLLFFRNIHPSIISWILLKQQQIPPPFYAPPITHIIYSLFPPLFLSSFPVILLSILSSLRVFSVVCRPFRIFLITFDIFLFFLCFRDSLFGVGTIFDPWVITYIFLCIVNSLLPDDPRERILEAVDFCGFLNLGDDGDIVSIVKLIIVHCYYYFANPICCQCSQ